MTLEELADKISATAKAEGDVIVRRAKTEAEDMKAEAEAEAAADQQRLQENAAREAAQLSTEMSAAARQHNQKRLLIAKRQELDVTWQSVLQVVETPGMKGRSNLLRSMLAHAVEQDARDAVLRPVAIDRRLLEDINSGFAVGDDVDGLGGFVVESDGGAVSLDYRFDSRLQDAWDERLAAVTETLFG